MAHHYSALTIQLKLEKNSACSQYTQQLLISQLQLFLNSFIQHMCMCNDLETLLRVKAVVCQGL